VSKKKTTINHTIDRGVACKLEHVSSSKGWHRYRVLDGSFKGAMHATRKKLHGGEGPPKPRNQWSVGKVYHANAGELHDGIRLMGADGKPFKRAASVVIIQSRYFGQICEAWREYTKKGKKK